MPPGSSLLMRAILGALSGAALLLLCAASRISEPDALAEPRPEKQVGLPPQSLQAAIPADEPLTPQKIALGKKLFFEPLLSADGSVSCATCHNPALAFTDGR